LESQLQGDLLTGGFAPEIALPTIKELAGRYGCGSETIRAVLRSLSRKGLITQERRRYYVSRGPGARGQAPICIISDAHHLLSGNELFWRLISAVEKETIHLNWPLAHATLRRGDLPRNAAAFICLSGKDDLLFRLEHRFPKVPLVLIDPDDSIKYTHVLKGKARRVLRIYNDHFVAGRQIATRLANHGHRRIAVVGPYSPDARWVDMRIRGIADIYPIDDNNAGAYSSRLYVGDIGDIPTPQESEEIERHAWKLRRSLRKVKNLPWRMQYFTVNATYSLTLMLKKAAGMEEMLSRALANKEVSAWICLNDETAAMAIHFLNRRNIRPGEDISVFGFDNSRLAYTMDISSYDFNFAGVGHVAVRWLERPGALNTEPKGEYVANGFIVERSSTGPGPAG